MVTLVYPIVLYRSIRRCVLFSLPQFRETQTYYEQHVAKETNSPCEMPGILWCKMKR